MVKSLDVDSTYEPSKRNWLKVKKDYLEGAGDTLDLVPIAAWYGKGKRTGVYGAYLLATYDPDSEEYQTICKIGTGFSEQELQLRAEFFNGPNKQTTNNDSQNHQQKDPNIKSMADKGEDTDMKEETNDIDNDNDNGSNINKLSSSSGPDNDMFASNRILSSAPRYYRIDESMKPDVYLSPSSVWEVKCADISVSPVHTCAIGSVHESKGLALRFPRFVKVRDDKKPDESTSSQQVVEMYQNQSVIQSNKKQKKQIDDEE